ncbi:UDP-2,4-diacetamido-2,4,6-trideoxy-beta-L-altropyranose hydrolase [Methanobrevibacter sp.]|uniref:UDP-2,4-diacetamido-2,4, 6-trideoxy-beta-L-altropyranose hydrolase n=1 Tax=Methanobrevibacter sp. TaxID=66852 RepID=UPI0025E66BBA|nr:UDP-2,4-diacetamido-2,4,6-trideoxy-beta-L-altropyranose hydrolase [Methanobrevibacter sp.]MBQ2961888.1 UDP-2,4-diacetamido-2,4,6-trideoxy-beta-L-altropyranose hydrolase [Methanobrevibacter sp.]
MYNDNKILVVIPARGGSKGIPRKNIRLLGGKPLIAHTIEMGKASKYVDDVIVTTDDNEIKFIAEKFGAETIKRDGNLAEDSIPLDPVIYDATLQKENELNYEYDLVITVQPTSPLLKTKTLDLAIETLLNPIDRDDQSDKNEYYDTIISVVDDRHLSWGYDEENKKYFPLYKERVNRQYLPKAFKETGSIFATKREFVKENSRLGDNIGLIEISKQESIDIDNYEDWWVAERILKKKRILIKADASHEIGTGHIYRALSIASKLVNHEVMFLLDEAQPLGIEVVRNNNYPYITHNSAKGEGKKAEDEAKDEIIAKIVEYDPDIVINDILNTNSKYTKTLRDKGFFIVNFEDVGGGVKYAHMVFDALYEHKIPLKNLYSGHKYYILKDEFYYQSFKEIEEEVDKVLLTFGGTDPNNLTEKVLESILESNYKNKIEIILGLGYANKKEIQEKYKDNERIEIYENVKNMSEHMHDADLIFTSAGRTMYEIASLGVPCICLCQNERELSHIFGNVENGFINLGLGSECSKEEIKETFESTIEDYQLRKEMNRRMSEIDLKHGFDNIKRLIKQSYKEWEEENK